MDVLYIDVKKSLDSRRIVLEDLRKRGDRTLRRIESVGVECMNRRKWKLLLRSTNLRVF